MEVKNCPACELSQPSTRKTLNRMSTNATKEPHRPTPGKALSGVLKALGYLLLLNLGAPFGTLLVVTVNWYQHSHHSEPFWGHLLVVHGFFVVVGLMFLVPLYGLACWLLPAVRRLWVPFVIGLLWVPVHALNPIRGGDMRTITSFAVSSAIVVLAVLVPALLIARAKRSPGGGTKGSG